MERIYCIEDCNNLKYVGRTKQTLNKRLINHRSEKKHRPEKQKCSSSKLDLENCSIKCIDIADSKEEAMELEWFYINSIDCVNHLKGNYDQKEYKKEYDKKNDQKNKEYRAKNKERKREYDKKYREKKKDKIKEYQKKYHEKKKLMNTAE